MKNKSILLLVVMLASCAPALAQKSDEWWKMSDARPANPKREAGRLTLNPIAWAFPAPGQVSVEIGGETYYQLAPEVFGRRRTIGEGKDIETALILFTPQGVAGIQMIQIQEPTLIPDLDRFFTMMAVKLAVKTPTGHFNEYVGKGRVFDMPFYFYGTKGGVSVGASISADHRRVLVMPAPSSP